MKGIKVFGKKLAAMLMMVLLIVGLAACSSSEEAGTSAAPVEKLQEVTQLTEDGVISEDQMKTIVGETGEYRFCGSGDGFRYVWTYNAKMVKNPQEQRLRVTLDNSLTEAVKEAANHAAVGLGFQLETMHMAAPATLEITLEEKWDADTVICCKYKEDTVYKMSDVTIDNSGEESRLTFQVTETGDTYYLVGGKSAAETEAETTAAGENAESPESAAETQAEANGTEVLQTEDAAASENTEGNSLPTCTISIECSTILNNWDDLDSSKAEFVPPNGWILYPSEVEFTPGETVFDVLKRVCAETGIHMSSRYTPMYGSYYIEGINQLYEFDCGQNSGWMYRVNGWYPNYGCSSYELSDGDNIEWRYTCDLGVDVGGGEY